jgi:mRNA-degrading endonuclease RelE of RelBE toxin-antitoxin system
MTFLIADTFSDSLGRLSGDEQKAVKTTAFDLQMNPASPGLQFHRLDKARDKNFWSVRVNADVRLIVHRSESSLLLCYVDHHDKAYGWAERRQLEAHPNTGAAQIVEIQETVREITVPFYVEVAPPTPSGPPAPARQLFAALTEEDLLGIGVPPGRLGEVSEATDVSFPALLKHLPLRVGERLLDIATKPEPNAPTPALPPSAFEHPDALRQFRRVGNLEELLNALDGPWDSTGNRLQLPKQEPRALTNAGAEDIAPAVMNARTDAERAERLFAWLVEQNRLISYSGAFQVIFQVAPVPFRNAVHVPRVLATASRTLPRDHHGLELRLDSLIVAKGTGRPGTGHFHTATYTPDQWASVLGSWPLIY